MTTNIICEICGKPLKNSLGLPGHLHAIHNISVKKYYDTFRKTENEGKCVVCNGDTKFILYDTGYARVCSYQCSYKDPRRINKLKKIGVSKREERNEKRRKTCLAKYGVESTLQLPEVREKCIETIKSPNVIHKREQTNLKRYGAKNPMQNKEVQNKVKKTCLDKYGAECVLASKYGMEKLKETNLIKYGYQNPLYDDRARKEMHQRIIEKYGGLGAASSIIRNKMETTNLERYGVVNNFQLPYFNSVECWKKRRKTMIENGTHSSYESYFESMLKTRGFIKDKTYMTQYKDEKYPFYCDFYLPESDTYIEINGYWTHGGHWFNPINEKDKETLSKLIEKALEGHHQYERAIECWTKTDVLKRRIAQTNNLNYIVLWSKEDIDRWFNADMPLRKDWSMPIKKSNTYKIVFENNAYMIVDDKYTIEIKDNSKSYIMLVNSINHLCAYTHGLKIHHIEVYDNKDNKALETIYI